MSVHDVDYVNDILDFDIINLCRKERFLEIIHNFIVFDAGVYYNLKINCFM